MWFLASPSSLRRLRFPRAQTDHSHQGFLRNSTAMNSLWSISKGFLSTTFLSLYPSISCGAEFVDKSLNIPLSLSLKLQITSYLLVSSPPTLSPAPALRRSSMLSTVQNSPPHFFHKTVPVNSRLSPKNLHLLNPIFPLPSSPRRSLHFPPSPPFFLLVHTTSAKTTLFRHRS